ncbi:MAG: hypothetical protein M1521_00440 [Thermotogae bacterium]|jgi:hypothetical protein|nr:hypothetical protein [Thermotogota bacterium]
MKKNTFEDLRKMLITRNSKDFQNLSDCRLEVKGVIKLDDNNVKIGDVYITKTNAEITKEVGKITNKEVKIQLNNSKIEKMPDGRFLIEERQNFGIKNEPKIKKFLMNSSQESQQFQLRYPAGGGLLVITFNENLSLKEENGETKTEEWLKKWFNEDKKSFFDKKDTYFFTILRTPPAIHAGYLTLSNGVGECEIDLTNPYAMVGSEPAEEIIVFVKDHKRYKIALPDVKKIFDLDYSNSLITENSENSIIGDINSKIKAEKRKHTENKFLKKYSNDGMIIEVPSYIFTLPINELVIKKGNEEDKKFKGTIVVDPQYGAIDFLGFLVMDFSQLKLSLDDIYFIDGEEDDEDKGHNFLGRPIYLLNFKDIPKLMNGNNIEIRRASFGTLSGNNVINTKNNLYISKPLMTPELRTLLQDLISSNSLYDPSEGEIAYLNLNKNDVLSIYSTKYQKRPFTVLPDQHVPDRSDLYGMFKILYRRFINYRDDINEYLQFRDILGGVDSSFIKGIEKTIEYTLKYWRTNNFPYFVDHNQGHSTDIIILLLDIMSWFPEQFRMEDLYILINAALVHDVAMYSYKLANSSQENLRKIHALKSARLFLEGMYYIPNETEHYKNNDLETIFNYIYHFNVDDLNSSESHKEKIVKIEERFRLARIALITLYHSTSWTDNFNTNDLMKLYELSFGILHKLRLLKLKEEGSQNNKKDNYKEDLEISFREFKDKLQELLNGDNVDVKVDDSEKNDVYRDIILTELFRLVDAMDVQQNRFGFRKKDNTDDLSNYIRWKMMYINGMNITKSQDEKLSMVKESLLHNYAHMSNKSVQFEKAGLKLNIVIEDNSQFNGLSQYKRDFTPEMKDKIRLKAINYLIYPEVNIFNKVIEEIKNNKDLDDS